MAHEKPHTVNLPIMFLLLLLFTAAEIALYEFWRHSGSVGEPFVSKHVLVIMIFIFTLPKAFIVMTYFMHLRFEHSLLVLLALLPFTIVAIMIIPILSDIRTLSPRNYTHDKDLAQFKVGHGEDHDDRTDEVHDNEEHAVAKE